MVRLFSESKKTFLYTKFVLFHVEQKTNMQSVSLPFSFLEGAIWHVGSLNYSVQTSTLVILKKNNPYVYPILKHYLLANKRHAIKLENCPLTSSKLKFLRNQQRDFHRNLLQFKSGYKQI